MSISVFMSYPKPHMRVQQDFIDKVSLYFQTRGLAPRTLGVTDYDMDAPLKAIRRLMLESNGLITIAFRRTKILTANVREGADLPGVKAEAMTDTWLTSPYSHIEPAMAYQLGLPLLIFREEGVIADGMLDRGVIGNFMPVFDLTKSIDSYLASPQFNDVIHKWEGLVRAVVETKGNPPKLF